MVINWKYEVRSTLNTFAGIFVGAFLASPLINAMTGSDLPTVQQFRDLYPLFVDTLYRAAWMTFLTKVGLSHRSFDKTTDADKVPLRRS